MFLLRFVAGNGDANGEGAEGYLTRALRSSIRTGLRRKSLPLAVCDNHFGAFDGLPGLVLDKNGEYPEPLRDFRLRFGLPAAAAVPQYHGGKNCG